MYKRQGPVNGTGTDDVNLSGGGTAFTLGSAVLNSSLTSVGTLSSLNVSGTIAHDFNANFQKGIRMLDNGGHSMLDINGTGSATGTAIGIYNGAASAYTLNIKHDGTATFAGNITPSADATVDLGSSTKRWANIYSADLQLSNEGGANDVDGTWGQYTIQEGEDDLFLINRRSGKKYKFMLQEVQ